MLRLTQAIATVAAAIALTAAATVPAMAVQRTAAHPKGEYYLSLGDSLSVGDQPRASGVTLPTDAGYADQLHAALWQTDRDLQLVKLGCPGETTQTLNKGGICSYQGAHRTSLTGHTGSQLAAAVAFLRFHPGAGTPLITIDIGANDLNPCIALGVISKIVACLPPVFTAIQKNLTVTLATLRKVAPHATIVGMSYYDPELVAWLTGSAGQTFAQASIILATQFNQLIESVFQAFKVPFADVFTAFGTTDMKDMVNVPPFGKLPLDVARICQLTWECAPKPVGPNEHANRAGYAVITKAFLATIRRIPNAF